MLIYLKPLSIFPELHSDTLFGAITYAISQLYPEKVDEMVKSFEDEPPFIISSTFPFIFKEDFENGKKIKFYPKIIFPQKSKDLEEKYHPKDFKEYKKVKNGMTLANKEKFAEWDLVVLEYQNRLVAIYKKDEKGYKAERVWN